MEISTEVLVRGKPRFTSWGQRLPDSLHDTDQQIAPGLVQRLYRYGLARMEDCGFNVEGWDCRVYTMDGELDRSERYYCVEFTNAKGGMIGVQGVAIGRGGHPCLDHGVSISEDRVAYTPTYSEEPTP